MLERVPVLVGRALRGARAGASKLAVHALPPTIVPVIEVWSEAFEDGGVIPTRHTADGEGSSPPLCFRGAPAATSSLVVIVEDADSPSPEPLVHAIAWNLRPEEGRLPEGALSSAAPGRRLGRNSLLQLGYMPPDPPPGHGPHHYTFQVFALSGVLDFVRAPGRRALLAAMSGHVIARGSLTGTYERRR